MVSRSRTTWVTLPRGLQRRSSALGRSPRNRPGRCRWRHRRSLRASLQLPAAMHATMWSAALHRPFLDRGVPVCRTLGPVADRRQTYAEATVAASDERPSARGFGGSRSALRLVIRGAVAQGAVAMSDHGSETMGEDCVCQPRGVDTAGAKFMCQMGGWPGSYVYLLLAARMPSPGSGATRCQMPLASQSSSIASSRRRHKGTRVAFGF
jgi:hypothetical protein